jgi:hypothetical protein
MSTTKIRGNTQILDGSINVAQLSINADLPFASHKITGLADGVNPQDAVTKAQLDAMAAGVDIKASVRVATTTNITLSGTQTIDGVALSIGNRVLVKNQTTASQNGIYVVASSAWTRATDADASVEVTSGMFCFVEVGTTNANSGWILSTPDPIVLGTTSLTFVQFSGAGSITAGNGLTQSGSTITLGTPGSLTATSTNAVQTSSHTHAIDSSIARSAITVTGGTGLSGGGALTGNQVISLNTHNHQSAGAAGGQLDHGLALTGLGDDDHTQYWNDARGDAKIATHAAVKTAHGLVTPTAASDFMIASASGTWAKKTLAETKTILGLGSAAYVATTTFEPAGAVSTHAALTSGVHGMTGPLGTAAYSASGDFASAGHNHSYMVMGIGSQATPSIRVSGDETVGLFSPDAFQLGVAVNNATVAIFTSTGINLNGKTITNGSMAYSLLSGVPATFAPSAHNHDDLYYTKSQIDVGLGDKLDTIYFYSEMAYYTPTARYIAREVPTGLINGSNAAFTIAFRPNAGSEHVYVNGILQNGASNDYSINNTTKVITFVAGSIPQTGDTLLVSYISTGVA